MQRRHWVTELMIILQLTEYFVSFDTYRIENKKSNNNTSVPIMLFNFGLCFISIWIIRPYSDKMCTSKIVSFNKPKCRSSTALIFSKKQVTTVKQHEDLNIYKENMIINSWAQLISPIWLMSLSSSSVLWIHQVRLWEWEPRIFI